MKTKLKLDEYLSYGGKLHGGEQLHNLRGDKFKFLRFRVGQSAEGEITVKREEEPEDRARKIKELYIDCRIEVTCLEKAGESGGDKPRVSVFVTRRSKKFRAKVMEPGKTPYEVTVGGKSWKGGKGTPYQGKILEKCSELLKGMKAELILAESADQLLIPTTKQ